jgi:Helix-loop-helix DNA-binding domain
MPLTSATAALTEDSHTLLLATRSNYQNLIEGTTLPGVSYPSELSTNLTSKRTSHKIAEQGRRNRINLALQEMLSLLPRAANGSSPRLNLKDGSGDGDDDDDKKGGLGKGSGSSKAATVESAIEYIRALQKETKDRMRAIEEKDREVDELRRKLGEMERRFGEGSNTGTSEGETNGEKSKSCKRKDAKE